MTPQDFKALLDILTEINANLEKIARKEKYKMLKTLTSFNQGELEVRILLDTEKGVKTVFIGFAGESPRIEISEAQLFFIHESLIDYFKEEKYENN